MCERRETRGVLRVCAMSLSLRKQNEVERARARARAREKRREATGLLLVRVLFVRLLHRLSLCTERESAHQKLRWGGYD